MEGRQEVNSYLLDTNVWLERLLGQEKREEVGDFLSRVPSEQLNLSDFSFHSIGVILSRLNEHDLFVKFTRDLFLNGDVVILSLKPTEMEDVMNYQKRFGLDFDDAYQYVISLNHNLVLLSFDTDFDKTNIARKTPGEIKL